MRLIFTFKLSKSKKLYIELKNQFPYLILLNLSMIANIKKDQIEI